MVMMMIIIIIIMVVWGATETDQTPLLTKMRVNEPHEAAATSDRTRHVNKAKPRIPWGWKPKSAEELINYNQCISDSLSNSAVSTDALANAIC